MTRDSFKNSASSRIQRELVGGGADSHSLESTVYTYRYVVNGELLSLRITHSSFCSSNATVLECMDDRVAKLMP